MVSSVIRTGQVHPSGQEAVEVCGVWEVQIYLPSLMFTQSKTQMNQKEISEGSHRVRPWLADRGI